MRSARYAPQEIALHSRAPRQRHCRETQARTLCTFKGNNDVPRNLHTHTHEHAHIFTHAGCLSLSLDPHAVVTHTDPKATICFTCSDLHHCDPLPCPGDRNYCLRTAGITGECPWRQKRDPRYTKTSLCPPRFAASVFQAMQGKSPTE